MPDLNLSDGFKHIYEVRPRKDKRGVDLISDALPFGRLWYDGPNAAQQCSRLRTRISRSHGASDSRLRCGWQRDRNARAQGQLQGMVSDLPLDKDVSVGLQRFPG